MLNTSTSDTLEHAHSEIHTCDASIDTLEMFFPRSLTREQYQSLANLVSDHGHRLKECKIKGGFILGYLLIANRPTLTFLQQIEPYERECGGKLSRLDVAFDFFDPNLSLTLQRHVMLRWRRKGEMHDLGDGEITYWCRLRKGKKRPNRNLNVYKKEIDGVDIVRLELKLFRPSVIRNNGFHQLSDLFALNPHALFNKHLKWSELGDKYVKEVVRKTIKEDRKRMTGKTVTPFVDRYRSRIRHRVEDAMRRTGNDRAQIVHDNFPKRKVNSIPIPLQIPTTLTFRTL